MGVRRGRNLTLGSDTTYGQRGGVGPTAGRKSETLIDPVTGAKKRAFFGQRWLCVIQAHETDKPDISAWHSQEEAEEHLRHVTAFLLRYKADSPICRVVEATVA